MAHTLRKVNLSHNRIVSLQYFSDSKAFNGQWVIESLDLNDNYIG